MSLRSKDFTNIENKYKYSNEFEIQVLTLASLFQAVSAQNIPDEMHTIIMMLGAKVGIDSNGTLNIKEKNLIHFIMGDIYCNNICEVYNILSKPVTDKDFYLVEKISKFGVNVSVPFLNYILCFAYIDGVIKNSTVERLDSIFNTVFI